MHYTVEVCILEINLLGMTEVDDEPQVLIGQEFAATLSCDLEDPDDTYAWTISGGDTFGEYCDYGLDSPYCTSLRSLWDFNLPVILLLGEQTVTSPGMRSYSAREDTIIISCTYYSALAGESTTLTKSFESVAPGFAFESTAVGSVTDYYQPQTGALVFGPYNATHPEIQDINGDLLEAGVHFIGSVTTPPEFIPSPQPSAIGGWHFIQNVTPNNTKQFTLNGPFKKPYYPLPYGDFGTPPDFLAANDLESLDGSYPAPAYQGFTPINGAYAISANGVKAYNNDSPASPLPGIVAENVTYYSHARNEIAGYDMYVMYEPIANGSWNTRGVPLVTWNWGWQATCTYDEASGNAIISSIARKNPVKTTSFSHIEYRLINNPGIWGWQ